MAMHVILCHLVLCCRSGKRPLYALDVAYPAAVQAVSVLCAAAGQRLISDLMHVPCSGVRVAVIAPDQQGLQGSRQQGTGGRPQAADGNPGHPGGFLSQPERISHVMGTPDCQVLIKGSPSDFCNRI